MLAIAYPELQITLLEPIKKRCNFLNTVVKELELTNVEVVNERAEDYAASKRGEYDLVTSRAVSSLSIMLELSVPFLRINGSALMMKGRNYNAELSDAENAIYILKVEVGKQIYISYQVTVVCGSTLALLKREVLLKISASIRTN